MAASASTVGWSRDSFWQQPSTYAERHRGTHLAMGPGGVSATNAALPSTQQHQQVAGATLGDQGLTEANGTGEGGDYSLRAHELIASRNSLYEVLETLGE